MTHTSRRALLTLAIPTLVLAACTRNDEPEDSATSTTPAPPSPSDLDGMPIQSDQGGEDQPMPAEADEDSDQAAIDAADATMSIWVQGSTLEEPEWREKLDETLTSGGKEATSNTWGYRVRDTEVTEPPEILRSNAGSAVLHVTTDYTTYEVTVVRMDDGQWKTTNLTTDLQEGTDQ